MGNPDIRIKIRTKHITSRNLHEAAWEIPYCAACERADGSRTLRFGWFKSFFETLTERVSAVEYLKLHNSVHTFRFENKRYLDLFLQSNSDKRHSDVTAK
jgi:hypothetical protein